MPLFSNRFIINDMAMLSAKSYEDAPVFSASSGWTAMNRAQLFGTSAIVGNFQNGVYNRGYMYGTSGGPEGNTAYALVAKSGSQMAIAFRGAQGDTAPGSSLLDDWAVAVNHQSEHFLAMIEVVVAALRFASNPATGISKIYFTGHSLGGAMAEYFAAHINDARFASILPALNKIHVVTFGSPGVDAPNVNPSNLLIEQIGHTGDPVFTIAEDLASASHLRPSGNRIELDLPFVSDGLAGFLDATPEHDIDQYQDSVDALLSSLTALASRDMSIAIGEKKLFPIAVDVLGNAASSGRQFLIGRNGKETLNGGTKSDLLDGGDGIDTLNGGGGDDVLHGGKGADELKGGEGVDEASYRGSSGVTVNLFLGTASGGDAQGDFLQSIENVTGSGVGDRIIGSLLSNRLDGGSGADTINGASGIDQLIGGSGDDTFEFGPTALTDATLNKFDTIVDYNSTGGFYSLGEGDRIDLSLLLGSVYTGNNGAALVRVIADLSGKFSLLRIDADGSGSANTWQTIARLDGIEGGDRVDVILKTGVDEYEAPVEGLSTSWKIAPGSMTFSEAAGAVTYAITRPDASTQQSVFVSTTTVLDAVG